MAVQHFRIAAPEKLFDGAVAGVRFHRGVAVLSVDVDAPRPEGATRYPAAVTALAYFRRKGYLVEEVDSPADVQPEPGPVGTPNSRTAKEAEVLGLQGAPTPAGGGPAQVPDGGQADDDKQTKPPAKSTTTKKEPAK